jgi:hypothetical protein
VQAHPIARIVVFEAQYGRELQPYKMQAVELRKPQTHGLSANNFVYAIATLTFSGTCSTGGDTLDFTQIADKLPST